MKHRSKSARLVVALFLTLVSTVFVTGCRAPLYYYPQNNFAGRATPPSGLQQRVLATFTTNATTGAAGGAGGAEILDGLRDIRSNVQNTIHTFSISGLTASYPSTIINFPEEQTGYILDYATGNLTGLNYAKENTSGTVGSYGAGTPSAAASPDGSRFIGVAGQLSASSPNAGQIIVTAAGGSYALNLPNVDRVVMNPGNTIMLAMTRNSNALYRVIQIPNGSTPVFPPGYVDCEPLILPVYCVVPVAGTYDQPTNAYFSLDGNSVYVLNSGPEYGGNTASVSVLQSSALLVTTIPAVNPLAAGAPSPMATLPVANPIPIPGGVTDAISDGTTLYLAGQSLYSLNSAGTLGTTPNANGLFTGYLTLLNQTTYVPANPISISDGTHTNMLFADNDTLWIGSTQCANGQRAAAGLNYNCLTMVTLGAAVPSATIIPSLTPGGATTVAYPNTNGNLYYYGDLTGLCWVQNYNKVFTAYGGQVHAFYTGGAITDTSDPGYGTTPPAGSEINNTNFTVQGTVLDVAYMDALTNTAN